MFGYHEARMGEISRTTRSAEQLASIVSLLGSGRAWISRVRFTALIWAVIIGGTTWAVIVLTSFVWLPVGVALAATAFSVNRIIAVIGRETCIHCGSDLAGLPKSEYGVACPTCGGLHQALPVQAQADASDIERYETSFDGAIDLGAEASAATAGDGETPRA